MRYLLIIPLFFVTLNSCSQSYIIDGKVDNFPGGGVYLASFWGEHLSVFDSLMVSTDGVFQFSVDENKHTGYYRIIMVEGKSVDLIFNKENISFTTDFLHPLDSLKIVKSTENRIYYDFLDFARNNQLRMDLLGPVTDFYPEGDDFYILARNQYMFLQKQKSNYIDSIAENYPALYVTKVLNAQKRPYLSPDLNEPQRINHLKLNYWNNIDFTDTSLLRSTVYTNLIIDYLSLYSNRRFSQEQLEDAFKEAVDEIMFAAAGNDVIYHFVLEYLLKGFEKYHFDSVIDHIASFYDTDEHCENETIDPELQKRLKNYQNLSIGKAAPSIAMKDINGDSVTFSNINNRNILLLFWASWCPHCNDILPKIHELYQNTDIDLEIIAISIDNNREDHLEAVREGNYSWINCSDYNGWDSKAALDYNIYATPTMFLLDENRIILAKPITYNELIKELGQL